MAAPIQFGLRPRDVRRSVWMLDPAVDRSPCPACAEIETMAAEEAEDRRRSHPAHDLAFASLDDEGQYRDSGEARYLRLRDGAEPLAIELRPLTRGQMGAVRDRTRWFASGFDHRAIDLVFRLGVRFPSLPPRVGINDSGKIVETEVLVIEDGEQMLHARLVDAVADTLGEGVVPFYAMRILQASSASVEDRLRSSPGSTEAATPASPSGVTAASVPSSRASAAAPTSATPPIPANGASGSASAPATVSTPTGPAA